MRIVAHMAESGSTCYDADVAFTRWDPLRDLLRAARTARAPRRHRRAGWTPPVDVYETADALRRSPPNCPASRASRSSSRVEDTRLTIRGARPRPSGRGCRASSTIGSSAATAVRAHVRVRRRRSTSTRVTADLTDGVLTVTLPKVAGRAARQHRGPVDASDASPVADVAVRHVGLRRRPGPHRPDADAPTRAAAADAAARRRAADPRAAPRRRSPAACPTSPRVAAARHHERDEHLVAAGRAHAELAVRERSVLPLLLRRSGRCVRLPRSRAR